ncbi:hypothetical protein [Bacillus sp. AFS014408]|nr:hypothetical protein [Bacillus sp. AFS014408]
MDYQHLQKHLSHPEQPVKSSFVELVDNGDNLEEDHTLVGDGQIVQDGE